VPLLTLALLLTTIPLAFADTEPVRADAFIDCGALYEIMAELESAEGRSISARDLRALGRQAKAAATLLMSQPGGSGGPDSDAEPRSEEEIAEYIAARRETAINHYLGVLEALDNESFEASAQTCMETIDMQKAIVSGAVE
jgi:hypothetical protein